jgi:hypothetical protein
MADVPPPHPPPPPGSLPSKRKMSAQEVWAMRQLDLLAASRLGNLASALKRPSPLCSRPPAMSASTMAAPSEITDLTDGSSSTALPAPQSIAACKAPAYAGPSLLGLWCVGPALGAFLRHRQRPISLRYAHNLPDSGFRLGYGQFWHHPTNVLCPMNGRPAVGLKCMWW